MGRIENVSSKIGLKTTATVIYYSDIFQYFMPTLIIVTTDWLATTSFKNAFSGGFQFSLGALIPAP